VREVAVDKYAVDQILNLQGKPVKVTRTMMYEVEFVDNPGEITYAAEGDLEVPSEARQVQDNPPDTTSGNTPEELVHIVQVTVTKSRREHSVSTPVVYQGEAEYEPEDKGFQNVIDRLKCDACLQLTVDEIQYPDKGSGFCSGRLASGDVYKRKSKAAQFKVSPTALDPIRPKPSSQGQRYHCKPSLQEEWTSSQQAHVDTEDRPRRMPKIIETGTRTKTNKNTKKLVGKCWENVALGRGHELENKAETIARFCNQARQDLSGAWDSWQQKQAQRCQIVLGDHCTSENLKTFRVIKTKAFVFS